MRVSVPRHLRLWALALVIWLLVLTATPIAGWTAGDGTFPAMATLGVLAHAAATLIALRTAWPVARIVRAALIVAVGTWGIEALGTATGFPFGAYHYTDKLQPQLAAVPLLIPLAWLMMLPPAWAVTDAILSDRIPGRVRIAVFAALSGVVFTAWDLYLDPQMVARELWLWDESGGYFGIPWINFAGWWATAALLTLIVRPDGLPRRALMVIYTLVWLFQAVGLGIFWSQPGPALAGFVGMGVFVVWGWWKELAR